MKANIEGFLQLEKELEAYKSMMAKAVQTVLDKEVTKYPIFVIHQHRVELGIPLVEREKVKGNWSVNISSLEEFVTKRVVFEEKLEEFKKNYKNTDNNFCLFVLSELGAQFIYLPRL